MPKSPTVADAESGGHSRERAERAPGSQVAKEKQKTRYSKKRGQNREEEMLKYQKRSVGKLAVRRDCLKGLERHKRPFLNQRNQTPVKKRVSVQMYYTVCGALDKSHNRERSSQGKLGEETKSQEELAPRAPTPSGQGLPGEARGCQPWGGQTALEAKTPPREEQARQILSEGESSLEEKSHVGTANSGGKPPSAHFRALEEGAKYGEEVRRHSAAQAAGDLQEVRFEGRGRGRTPGSKASHEEA